MTKREWQYLNERLAETAQQHEAERNWAGAACWVALADLRDEAMGGTLRRRAAECWQREATL